MHYLVLYAKNEWLRQHRVIEAPDGTSLDELLEALREQSGGWHNDVVYVLSIPRYVPGTALLPCYDAGKWNESGDIHQVVTYQAEVLRPAVQQVVNGWRQTAPALARCQCGAEFEMMGYRPTCPACGLMYSPDGQGYIPFIFVPGLVGRDRA